MLFFKRHASFHSKIVTLTLKIPVNYRGFIPARLAHSKKIPNDKLSGLLKDLVMNNQRGKFQPREKQKLRHVKYREKKGSLGVSDLLDLHVIGSGGPGASKSLLITTTFSRYLFNCGEGVQRMTTESKLKISKLENIFITHKSWENIGGVLGMCLTLEGVGVPKVILHGPPGVETVARNSFAFAEKNRVEIDKQKTWTKNFSDANVDIDYVPLLPESIEKEYNPPLEDDSSQGVLMEDVSTKNREMDEGEISQNLAANEDGSSQNTETDGDDPPAKKKRYTIFTPLTDPNVTVAYIVRPHPRQRHVILDKCVELGIDKGPMIGKLKDGLEVTLENGTVIHPDQVLDEEEILRPIIVVECPSDDHLYSLLNSKQMLECQKGENSAELVVHMTSYDIVQNPIYQLFIQKFPESTNHLFLHEKTKGFLCTKHLQSQTWLNMLYPQVFPQLTQFHQSIESPDKENMIIAKPFVKYAYRPKKGFCWDGCIEVSPEEEFRKEINNNNDTMQSMKDFQELLSKTNSNSENQYPEIAVLGTGSSYPSLNRNVTGNLINIDDQTSLILDCGEDTIGQLYRMYGDQTDEMLIKIKVIFISHLHPDHHLGMIGIVNARVRALAKAGMKDDPVLLCAPIQIHNWLNANRDHFGALNTKLKLVPLQFLMTEPYRMEGYQTKPPLIEEVLKVLNCVEFRPVSVVHNMHACGISIVHKSGWKIVYSGDTRPCPALVNVGKDCDLLIHEATLEDGWEEDAALKKHSTMTQAVDIGVQMKAKFTLLTHFSQRYPKFPYFKREYDHPVGVAFDCMKVKLSEINILKDLIKPLQVIFDEEIKYMSSRTSKVLNKKQLLQEKKTIVQKVGRRK